MTNREVGLLTFRSLAIYSGILALQQSERIVTFWPNESVTESSSFIFIQTFTPLLLLSGCSIVIWLVSPRVVHKMFHPTGNNEEHGMNIDTIKTLIYSTVGLLLLVDTIRDLVKALFLVMSTVPYDINDVQTLKQRNFIVVVTILKLGIGFWLFLGNRAILQILGKVRGE